MNNLGIVSVLFLATDKYLFLHEFHKLISDMLSEHLPSIARVLDDDSGFAQSLDDDDLTFELFVGHNNLPRKI